MNIIIYLFVNGFAVFIASKILPGIHVDSFVTAIIIAVVLGVINTFIKPILSILAFPITLLTLGLFTLVINGVLVILASLLVSGFVVDNFLWAVAFSFITSLVSSFLRNAID